MPLAMVHDRHHGQVHGTDITHLLASAAGFPNSDCWTRAQALAKESGAFFINIRPSTLQSKWFGDSQRLVQAIFSLAWKLQPCIIFLGSDHPLC